MSVINTNILALTSQNNLQKSQSALGSAIERLSSGMRINSAKDDAAGQAIANRFTANVRGLTQAARNANDGISIAQTTEGSLDEINNNLQRIRELTVQAANGSNSASDLKSIQDEITERLDEINRISEQTDFNGVKVLASGDDLVVQVGAHDNETIKIELKAINVDTLKLDEFRVDVKDVEVGTALNASDVDSDATSIAYTGDLNNPELYKAADGDQYYVVAEDGKVYTAEVEVNDTTVNVTVGDEIEGAELDGDTIKGVPGYPGKAGLLKQLDGALQQVDDLRSHLGAIQNRFESTITNLNNTVNNLSAARSRIEDADYAVEVSNMTRAQILQQAGTSVLAQANQVPQTVLSLLR